MTLVNFHFTEKRACLVTDTLRSCDGRPVSFHQKASLLPTIPAILSGRGLVVVADEVERALGQWYTWGLISTVSILPIILDKAVSETGTKEENEFFLIGWCNESDRMRGFAFRSGSHFKSVELSPGAYLNPPLNRDRADKNQPYELAKERAAVDFLTDTAKVQHSCHRLDRDEKGMPVGGDLQMIEMTKTAFRLRTVYRFPDYDECEATMKERLRA